MTKPEWGKKRVCPTCANPYYDMRRKPIICPNCRSEFDERAAEQKTLEKKKVAADSDFTGDIELEGVHEPLNFDETDSLVSDMIDDADEFYTTNDVSDLFKESPGSKRVD